jgi:hypothetical protein
MGRLSALCGWKFWEFFGMIRKRTRPVKEYLAYRKCLTNGT